ncbi:16S rRNA (adenine(1518)-N(6)/adenine(1519)-N(6))-dimethyltransferase RsmA [Spirulina major CS-329]|uniref:16S rRNA (adenine(1518)-N(6)/adenine(1519)-N(6))- dimethyltransferase RsmA n=1 Tax=Spirulina TaxID=1154 RepID=UPI0023311A3A|nr:MULTISPECIES: 16S rRNA (adenine(1518)-N(6)/adenine(1519)-N(6))-dimethyltransferase RsmA [Spirulina]MDB9494974.1 16S rRNA (adenine(1518)-N(6)/adenine(1519)-N(6))-dimethyltransferase RsmA [Spirulina subsalsa CS-330]MDB9501492.1 16S rRNA (adenine(1518)-N(6)/adenine(1519)-N(6))-dimethyltransferase RsmA [Spirulina major CS-329]
MPRPRKRFAQHWLRSDAALRAIINAAELTESDRILEIGPGTGSLTQHLLPKAAAVVGVEIDEGLCRQLPKRFPVDNLFVIEGDILQLDLAAQLAEQPHFQAPNKVVANIPYNITGPLLEYLLGRISQPVTPPYDVIVLLVQKEIADRVSASPGSKAFGVLSVRVQYLADAEIICAVPRTAFKPAPKVESAVIRLRPRPPIQPARDPKHLEILIKQAFSSKRKMLRNNIKGLIEPEQLLPVLTQLGINPEARPEALSVAQWVALSDALGDRPLDSHS